MIKHTIAIDYESFYSKEVSIKTMGAYAYLRDPKMDIYMLSVVADNGFQFVGRPEDFDWMSISGPEFRVISHNYTFESNVNLRLKELGIIPPEWKPGEEHCTADMCAYLALPRSLANACKAVFKVDLSKAVRSNMSGKLPSDLTPKELADLLEYALVDSVWCLKLWQKCSHAWPQWEREVSRINREAGMRGIDIDVDKLQWAERRLRKIMAGALRKLPWIDAEHVDTIIDTGQNPVGLQPMSKKAVAIECEKLDIEAPTSMAKDSEEFEEWLEENSPHVRWINAIRAYRRSNMLREKVLTILRRQKPDGRTTTEWLYCGAGNTKRFSGAGGVNYQNLSRQPIFGIQLRHMLLPGAGCIFGAGDLSQIEARCLPWFAGDTETLDMIRSGIHIYEAHGRRQMGWTGGKMSDLAPTMYALAKARVLALGFGAGHMKFLFMAKGYVKKHEYVEIFNVPVRPKDTSAYLDYSEAVVKRKGETEWKLWLQDWEDEDDFGTRSRVNAWLQVNDFRKNSPKLTDKDTGLWSKLDRYAHQACHSPEQELRLELPSGNYLIYRHCRRTSDGVSCVIVRNGMFQNAKIYGGLLAENLCQALARDIFAWNMVKVEAEKFDIALHTHDENLTRLLLEAAQEKLDRLIELMSSNPPWIPDLPIGADGKLMIHYKK